MKILIIRHGDPNYEIDSLTPTGWEEAELLANKISKLNVKNFYVSPMGRAQDTLSPTLKRNGQKAEILPWLHEFDIRIQKPYEQKKSIPWDWLPEVWTKEPTSYDVAHWADLPCFREAEVGERYQWVIENFNELLAKHGYVRDGKVYRAEQPNEDTIVMVCHFGLECVLLSYLLDVSPMVMWHLTCAAPTSVTTLVTEERREKTAIFRMSTFGDVSHLYAGGREPSFAARFCETYADAAHRD